jgi:NADH-quinone oxidoreductase subunit F
MSMILLVALVVIFAMLGVAAWPIQGLVKHFRPELERRIAERGRTMLEAAE